jgi:hypothetical protein
MAEYEDRPPSRETVERIAKLEARMELGERIARLETRLDTIDGQIEHEARGRAALSQAFVEEIKPLRDWMNRGKGALAAVIVAAGAVGGAVSWVVTTLRGHQ